MSRLLLLLILTVAVAGCGGRSSTPPSTDPSGALPPFPVDKRASVITKELLGIETFSRSSQVTEYQARAVIGPAPPEGVAWAMYKFSGVTEQPQKVTFAYSWFQDMNEVGLWLAVADFTTGHWRLAGPYSPTTDEPELDLTADSVSPLGNVYVAVIIDSAESQYMIGSATLHTDGDNTLPVAKITSTPEPVYVGRDTEVTLDASGSTDSDGTIVRYQWDLDEDYKYEIDGPDEFQQVIELEKSTKFRLRVTDDKGSVDTAVHLVTYTENYPPVAAYELVPESGNVGGPLALDASSSSDPNVNGDIVKYEWDLDGDGSYEVDNGSDPVFMTTFPATHQRIGLGVTDDFGSFHEIHFAVSPNREVIDGSSSYGGWAHLATVYDILIADGHPAMVYRVPVEPLGKYEVRFVRALDPLGSEWGQPKALMEGQSHTVPNELKFEIIAGKPAFACVLGLELLYVAANDSLGNDWAAPVVIDTPEFVADGGFNMSLAQINGKPAIAYSGYSSGEYIRYMRAADPSGQSWSSATLVDDEFVRYCALAEIDGYPSLAYSWDLHETPEGEVRYQRALDVDGTAWTEPVVIAQENTAVTFLGVVDGLPTVASSYEEARYFRSNDIDGNTWEQKFDVPSWGLTGVAFAVAAGKPAMGNINSLGDGMADFNLFTAQDTAGDSWNAAPLYLNTAAYTSYFAVGMASAYGFAFSSEGKIYYDRVDL